MSLALRRKLANLSLSAQKTVTYGVAGTSRRQLQATARPIHRQYGTVFTPTNALRQIRRSFTPASVKPRHIHARAISYSSIPRFVFRAFRVPAAGATIGAGGLTYANYKFEREHHTSISVALFLSRVQRSANRPPTGYHPFRTPLPTSTTPHLMVSRPSRTAYPG